MRSRIIHIIALVLAVVRHPVGAADVPDTGNVFEWIMTHPAGGPKASKHVSLNPQWIGTVKVVLRRDPDKIHDDEKDDPMRLNQIWSDDKGRVVIGRVAKDSSYSSPAVFVPRLPSLKELHRVTKPAELRNWFGPQEGWTDGWGMPGQSYWTESWVRFTTDGKDRLRWLSVSAIVSAPEKALDQAKIDQLVVREGFLRPADPKSVRERAAYPSADDLADAEELQRKAERAKLPEPLRDLIAAKQKRGDHNLRAYLDAINRIRTDPQPGLFNQLAERIGEGTCEIQGIAEDILSDKRAFEGRKSWQKDKKRIALRQAVAAIDHVPDHSSLETWTARILSAIGGGRIVALGIEVKGGSSTFGSGPEDSKSIKSAKAATRREFETKFPFLRGE